MHGMPQEEGQKKSSIIPKTHDSWLEWASTWELSSRFNPIKIPHCAFNLVGHKSHSETHPTADLLLHIFYLYVLYLSPIHLVSVFISSAGGFSLNVQLLLKLHDWLGFVGQCFPTSYPQRPISKAKVHHHQH